MQRAAVTAPPFSLGRLMATPAALALLASAGVSPAELLVRHQSGDWGEMPCEDARENELSVREGFRIISSYPVSEAGERTWTITEADTSSTCILLPSEYWTGGHVASSTVPNYALDTVRKPARDGSESRYLSRVKASLVVDVSQKNPPKADGMEAAFSQHSIA
jgi:hypothetical protein